MGGTHDTLDSAQYAKRRLWATAVLDALVFFAIFIRPGTGFSNPQAGHATR